MTYSKGRIFFLIFIMLGAMTFYSYRTELDAAQERQAVATEIAMLAKRAAVKVNLDQLACLSANIYHEAAGEPFMGQVAVARVVINRIRNGFARTPCAVIYQKTTVHADDDTEKTVCQFSWVCENKALPAKNTAAYRESELIAHKVLTEDAWRDSIPSTALFFHHVQAAPKWSYNYLMTIGNHSFYAKR